MYNIVEKPQLATFKEQEEVDSGIVTEYQFTDNNNHFSVQNIVRRPGCETFIIDFSDGVGGKRPPPGRLGPRSQSALVVSMPAVDNNKNAKRQGGNKQGQRAPIIKEEGGREPIRKKEGRREPIRKEEKNEINKSLRNHEQDG